jgi:tetratricopeptide (TPR) repeat protein
MALCHWYLCDDRSQAAAGYRKQLEGNAQSLAEAIVVYQDILSRDTDSARRWADLGEGLWYAGNLEKARYCYSRALTLGRNHTEILLNVADFHFQLEEYREALEHTSSILATTNLNDDWIFSHYSVLDTREVLKYGIPQDQRAAHAYFRFLLSQDKIPDLMEAWKWLASHSLSTDRLAADFGEFLVRRGQPGKAAESLRLHLGDREGGYLKSDFLLNGSFEQEPDQTKLGWRIDHMEGVKVSRDAQIAASGKWSLRIEFDGKSNTEFRHISQRTFVKPGTYRFQAAIRTEGVTTDQGIRFHIFDAEAPPRFQVETEPFLGTTKGWKRIQTTFVIPPSTRTLTIQAVRRRSMRFDNRIQGTTWIDSVGITSRR